MFLFHVSVLVPFFVSLTVYANNGYCFCIHFKSVFPFMTFAKMIFVRNT